MSLRGLAARGAAQRRGPGAARGVPRRRGAHLRQRHGRRPDRVVLDRRLPAAAAGGAAQPVDPVDGAAAPRHRRPEYAGIHRSGPAALRALGVTRRAHPHGVVPPPGRLGGRVGGRRPAARRAADLDARLRPRLRPLPAPGPSWWSSTGSTPPERRSPRHGVPARQGKGRVRAVHGVEELQHADRPPGRGGAAARSPASRPRPTTWARATSWSATPTPRWCGTRCG